MVLWGRQARRRMGDFGQENSNIRTMDAQWGRNKEAGMKVNKNQQTLPTLLILLVVLIRAITDLKMIP